MNDEQTQQAFDPASFEHVPVLLEECLEGLNIRPGGIYLDGTAGGAGHSRAIASRLDAAAGGRLIALDQDPDAVQTARQRLAGLPAVVVQTNFRYAAGRPGLGRGGSHRRGAAGPGGLQPPAGRRRAGLFLPGRRAAGYADEPGGDHRGRPGQHPHREELARILRDYGEEPYAWQIAGKIVEAREEAPIQTTLQLAGLVASAMPPAVRRKDKNPARRSFQALRIAVNHELDALDEGLDAIFGALKPGGRFCVITFHSLEDRLVKNKFRRWATACTCPPEFPVCVCGGKAKAKLITRKPIEAKPGELAGNRRSRSARLRVLEKL